MNTKLNHLLYCVILQALVWAGPGTGLHASPQLAGSDPSPDTEPNTPTKPGPDDDDDDDDPCGGDNKKTPSPVRYMNGGIQFVQKDIPDPHGMRMFGHTRVYMNQITEGYINESVGQNGHHWFVQQWPYAREAGAAGASDVVIVLPPDQTLWFTYSGGTYTPTPYVDDVSLTRQDISSEGEFVLKIKGDTYTFRDYTGADLSVLNGPVYFTKNARQGTFKTYETASGVVVEVASWLSAGGAPAGTYDAGGQVQYLERSFPSGTTVDQLEYEYDLTYDFNGSSSGTKYAAVSKVTLRQSSDGGATFPLDLRRVEYDYYLSTTHTRPGYSSYHNGVLDTVTIKKPDISGDFDPGDEVSKTHYRYSVDNDLFYYFTLDYVFGPEAYRRLVADGESVASTNAVLAEFADFQFEYNDVSDPVNEVPFRRVTREVAGAGCGGCGSSGTGGDDFAYDVNGSYGTPTDIYNAWYRKTTVTQPDGNKEIVYTNKYSQPMLKVVEEYDATPTLTGRWATFFKYDSEGRLLWKAHPSAVDIDSTTTLSTIEGNLDLMNEVSGAYTELHNTSGLIETRAYYSSTTADDTTPGGVEGHLQYEAVRNGDGVSVTEVKLREYKYLKHSYDGNDVFPIGTEIIYPDAGTPSTTIETNYTYTWHEDSVPTETNSIESMTTILPLVPTAQNGLDGITYPTASWINSTTVKFYDTNGNLAWTKDEEGTITYTEHDIPSGRVAKRIEDVDTDLTSEFTDLPSGWSNPDGLHAVTDYTYDDLSRVIEVLGPSHTVDLSGMATIIRPANWTVYEENGPTALDETRTGRGYATGSAGSYSYTLINPVRIQKQGKDHRKTYDTITATRDSPTGKLSSSDTFTDQTKWEGWIVNGYASDGRLETVNRYHDIPSPGFGSLGTNYETTEYGYDSMGQRNRIVAPDGTITRTVYNALGNALSAWVGTDDTNATDTDPDAGSSNLLQVSAFEYDSGDDADDGKLTEVTQYAAVSDTRVTSFTHDFRGRRLTEDGEVKHYISNTYDNLGRVIQVDQYNTAETGTAPVGYLIASSKTEYDDRGRVYRTITLKVNPDVSGDGYNPDDVELKSNIWYDAAGNIIKTQAGGTQVFTKSVYDGLDRVIETYTGYDTAETSHADAGTVTGDTVVQQSEIAYDDAGNTLEVTTYQRDNDGTGTGKLDTGNARLNHQAFWFWYDGADRRFTSADYGTNGGSPFTRGSTAETASDTVLVTITDYDDAGRAYQFTDPADRITKTHFDDAGRQTYVIEGYDSTGGLWDTEPSDPASRDSDENRITAYTYTADGQIQTLTAVDPDHNGSTSDNQVTNYVYGVTTTDSDINSNRLLHAVIYPESNDVASPLGDGGDGVFDRVEMDYNRLGQLTSRMDQREAVHDYTYDKLGRLIKDVYDDTDTRIDEAVDGDVRRVERTYEVRGMLKKVTAYNATTGGTVVNDVEMAYNHFGQLVTDYQDHDTTVDTTPGTGSPRTSYAYEDGTDGTKGIRRTTTTYPNDRIIHRVYDGHSGIDDAISRANSIAEDNSGSPGDTIVDYTYLGSGRMVRKDYPGPEIRLDYWGNTSGTYDGFDDLGRVKAQQWVDYSGTEFDVFHIKHDYDRASNRLYADRQVYKSHSQFYNYDKLHRLDDYKAGKMSYDSSVPDGIENYWNPRKQAWNLDQLGNQLEIDTPESTDYYKATHDKDNQIDTRSVKGNQARSHVGDEIGTGSASNWSIPTEQTELVSVSATKLTFSGTMIANTLSGNVEKKDSGGSPVNDPRAIALLGEAIGPFSGRILVTIPSGGQAGWVFGYKDDNDYWTYVLDEPAGRAYLYHVEDGNKGTPKAETAVTVTTTTPLSVDVNFRRGSDAVLGYEFPGGFPSGKVGVYADTANTQFDYIRVYPDDSAPTLAGRWIGELAGVTTSGSIFLTGGALTNESALLLDGVRVERFEATFSLKGLSGRPSAKFIFNATDQDDYDYVAIYHEASGSETAPYGYEVKDGIHASLVVGTRTDGNVQDIASIYTKLWVRVRYDGSNLEVLTSDTNTDWGNASVCYTSASFDMAGGMIGFASDANYAMIDDLTLKADRDLINSDYEVTEYVDDFTLDGSGYAEDTIKYDAAGNLTYDGRHRFTYDAWNRLVEVKHAYRDAGETEGYGIGSTVSTMQYDGLGRRTVKAITNSAGQDGTYHYYYDGQSVIQTDNGSDQMLKQYVWGLQYIDELCQVGVNQDPANASSAKNEDTYKENEAEYYYYPMQDANFNNLGIVTEAGRLVERYEYTPYGQRITYSHGVLRGDVTGDGFVGTDDQNAVSIKWNQNITGPDPADINGDGYVGIDDLNVVLNNFNAGVVPAFDPDPLVTHPRLQSARFTSNGVANEGPALCDVGHQGLMHDEEFGSQGGLIYNRARMLHPRLGRFIQRDPVGYVDGMSFYQYVGSEPIGRIDPSGLLFGLFEKKNQKNFPDEVSAAQDRMDEALKGTQGDGYERCGMVCKDCDTDKYYTTSRRGQKTMCLPQLAPCKWGDKTISMWHTHTAGKDPKNPPDYFSDIDEWWSEKTNKPFWMKQNPDVPASVYPPREGHPSNTWEQNEGDRRWPFGKGPWGTNEK